MPAIHRRLPRGITTLLIAAMLTAVSPWSSAQRDASDALARARQALRRAAPDDCAAPTAEDTAALRRAVLVFRAAQDTPDEARALTTLGAKYDGTAQYRAAIPVLQRAAHITSDARLRVQAQTILADALQSVSRSTEALQIVKTAIDGAHRIGDPALEADALRVRAETNYAQKTADPMRDLAAGLNLTSETLGPKVRAEILNDEGAIESDSKQPEQAAATLEEALRIEERIHDCRDEGQTLSNLGSLEEDRGEASLALEAYNRALPLERQVGDRDSESKSLHALAKMHHDLGNLAEALKFYEQALAIEKQTGDFEAHTKTLVAIAGVYRALHKPQEARLRYVALLPKLRAAGRVTALNNLATVEADLGQAAAARCLYRRAMLAARKANDAMTPAYSWWGIGELEEGDALNSYFRALRLADHLDLPGLQGLVSASLMDHFRRRGKPDLAIFFGKQAVDDYQALRANLKGTPDAMVSSFVHEKAQTYRTLARLLIDEGRLSEAQQVLDLLKIQQYADYMQWQGDVPSATVVRTSAEQHLEEEYRSKAAQLTAAAKVADPGRVTAADQDLAAFLDQMPRRLASAQAGETTAQTDAQKALDAVLAEHPDTAIVYTLVNEDRYTAIVLTRKARVSRSYTITQAALDAKCRDFLKILREHRPHPETAAQELFRIIVAPIQRDLEDSGVKTVIWSLDGSMRFIPVSTLMDPRSGRYLVQDYNIANYTPLGHFETDTPQLAHATAIAMGVSRGYGTLPPLPNVPDELDGIVKDSARGARGPVAGTILLNDDFTRAAMEREVRSQTVVHIASHFVLEPGNDSASYLLVGGSDSEPMAHRLSLAKFKLDRNLKIQGTELVTLSACETGAENLRDDGVVMEGLSEAVLDKEAKAVISSLWQVNDRSTAGIMARFYKLWIGSGGKMTKSEALRRAQMELIEGHLQAGGQSANRGLSTEQSGPGRFADPYYWAPFVLTGNWQ
ncbi:MAG TPA: CHAT domain-containing tetratricopeptide repeat protein [Acidobacteriaceae bacterium]|nr:CHAT domain-containing tetratricopeptide repeat protein [Acidobacteriaceae bacterium]